MARLNNARTNSNFLFKKSILLILSALLFYGCGLKKVVSPPSEPQLPELPPTEESPMLEPPKKGPANALYHKAKISMSEGNNKKAEMEIERAIRIEPGNPYYWYTMGKIKYRQGAYKDAVQFCLKSKSLAGRNLKLLKGIDQLITQAKKDTGKM